MLKIKDDIDLKELEKFGFKPCYAGYIHYAENNNPNTRYFCDMRININPNCINNRKVEFSLDNMSIWCNDLEQLERDANNIKKSYEEFKKICVDLLQAGLLEEIKEE